MKSPFGSRSLSASAALLAMLLTLAPASHSEAQSAFLMLINFGAGWKESGGFATLEACKPEAAAFAAKYTVQAGCVAASALEKWRAEDKFQQAAARCAEQSAVQIIRKPGAYFTIFGTVGDRFAFDKCMVPNAQPMQ